MRVVFDVVPHLNGAVVVEQHVDTEPGKQEQVTHPALGPAPVDVIHLYKAWHDGTIPIAGTGWDEPANHPSYAGKTKFEVLIAEIIRLDDKPARAILGV